MAVTVVVPWRGGCVHRERAWGWVVDRYRHHHPTWAVIRADAPEGPWVKANAVMPAVRAAKPGTVVVADADVWCDGLTEAVEADAPWAVPHNEVRRLTEDATTRLLGAGHSADLELDRPAYGGQRGGGFVVAPRHTLLEVPMDPRFVGWGQEDASWEVALHWLAGEPWVGDQPLWHLWHPSQPRQSRVRGSRENWALWRRYQNARHDTDELRHLVEEAALVAFYADEQAVLDSSPVGVDHG